jgi:hypothetical protein
MPLGAGQLPLAQFVDTLRRARPGIRFLLEMIRRDPLPVPFARKSYWTTREGDDRASAERIAAKLLQAPRGRALPRIAGLSAAAAVALEDDHNRACLAYARDTLGL